MADVTLYEHPLSSYAQKIKIALREKGVGFTTLLPEGLGSGQPNPAFAALNPRLEVPVLVAGEDRILWLDQQMAGKTWICGDRYTLADIMFYCFMAFRAPEGGSSLPRAAPNLAAWFDRVKVRPSTKA